VRPATFNEAQVATWIAEIDALPGEFRRALTGLSEQQLDTPYRDGGWTVRQVAHHLPDSHMNGYIRFKLALTERVPVIKPYEEALWAELPDVRAVPVETPITIIELVHQKWVALLRGMGHKTFYRSYFHPEQGRVVPLFEALAMYAWHGRHHVAHVMMGRERAGA